VCIYIYIPKYEENIATERIFMFGYFLIKVFSTILHGYTVRQ